MTSKDNQRDYIKYLEDRLAKLSENSSIGDQDLNTLVDTQNEIIINNSYSLKKSLSEHEHLLRQTDELQKRNDMSDTFIQYLMDSFWWKLTQPFRFVSRHIKNHQTYHPYDFSTMQTIEDNAAAIIYATSADDNLIRQVKSLQEQAGFNNLKITIIDLASSSDIAKIAKSTNVSYLNLVATDNSITLAKNLATSKEKYTIYLSQGVYTTDSDWLYKMVRPLLDKYALSSVLYDRQTSMIEQIKTESFFNELRSRIVKIGHYECMYLPANRNGVQYIPPIVMNGISAIAKKHE